MTQFDKDWRPEGIVTCGECARFILSPYNPAEGWGQCQAYLDYEKDILQRHKRKVRGTEYDAAQRRLGGDEKPNYPGVWRYCRKFVLKI